MASKTEVESAESKSAVVVQGSIKISPSGKNAKLDAKIYDNTDQTVIQISEDRLELNARDYTENIKSLPEIAGWGGIAVSIFLTMSTAEFQDSWIFSGGQIKIAFLFISFFLILQVAEKLKNYFRYKCLNSDRAFDPKMFVKKCRTNINTHDTKELSLWEWIKSLLRTFV